MKRIDVEIEGTRLHGFALRSGGDLWVHVDGRTFLVPAGRGSGNRQRGQSTGSGSDGGLVRAPMPGKIVKITAEDGALVKAGQTLVVMEAMKMEYSLKAPFDGILKLQGRRAGEQVALGEPLAEVLAP